MNAKLYQGDCLIELDKLHDNAVDCIIADLPYGVTEYDWDKPIDTDALIGQMRRVLKPTGTILLFLSEPLASGYRMKYKEMYKYDLIWQKNRPTGFQHAKNKPLHQFEKIVVFSKGKIGHKNLLKDRRMTYNPQGILRIDKQYRASKSRFGGMIRCRPSHRIVVNQEYTNYPTDILKFDIERSAHPSGKPVALLEWLIQSYTHENEIVLDVCMGSGSTGIACAKTGRRFIGIEMDDHYFEIAKERIGNAFEY